jgi:UDP-N-acetylmuramate--alanine ligase
MGIGGAGMSALALLLYGMGFEVDGCDLFKSEYITRLEALGIECLMGHSPSHLEAHLPHLLVYSSAVNGDHEELVFARKKGIRTVGRGLTLSWLFNAYRGIGVAGAHGKTTTSSMIGLILKESGYDPTLAIGAEIWDFGTNARVGKGDFFVAEIDESDGSFEFFTPEVTAITNVDWDHVNYYPTRDELLSAFVRFARARKPGTPLVICAEDEGSQRLVRELGDDSKIVTCGWGKAWDWGAFDVTHKTGGGVAFSVSQKGKDLGRMELSVSGDHNIMNALLACASTSCLSVSFDAIRRSLSGFRGARRRLEKIGEKENEDIIVIDDYGHHPSEIAASLSAVRDIYPSRRLVVVFQPHRYTRTCAFFREFASALEAADMTLLLPIYSAGEAPREITSSVIADVMNADGYFASLCIDEDDALVKLNSFLRRGDVLMTLGAGNVFKLGEAYLKSPSTSVKGSFGL